MTNETRRPIIILGMHRSGTSMATRALESLGLFVGRRTQRNREALLFFGVNEWILAQAGAAWDHPEPVRALLGHREVRRRTEIYIRRLLRSPRLSSYTGLIPYLAGRRLDRFPSPWGWKDPRNTFTLPIWLDLFPDARVIHVVRHGVDVARSLQRRHHRLLEVRRGDAEGGALRLLLRPKRDGFTDSIRCARLEGGFSLWEEYVTEARRHTAALGERAIETRFEDLLVSPEPVLGSLARFCGIDPDPSRIGRVAEGIRSDRAFAFRGEEALRSFAEGVEDRLNAEGYEAIPSDR